MGAKIILVDDHPLMRRAIRSLLESDGLEILGEANGATELFALLTSHKPDLVLLDLSLGEKENGLEIIPKLRNLLGQSIRIVVHSMHDSALHTGVALRAGADAFVSKQAEPEELLESIQKAICAECVKAKIQQKSKDAHTLTSIEERVLVLIGEGHKPAQIAKRLSLSVHTIETHRRRIRLKLGIDDAAELTRFAISHRNL